MTAVVNDDNTITVKNVLNDSNEHLGTICTLSLVSFVLHFVILSIDLCSAEFNDKVVRVSMDWGHLVVATTTTGFIYR